MNTISLEYDGSDAISVSSSLSSSSSHYALTTSMACSKNAAMKKGGDSVPRNQPLQHPSKVLKMCSAEQIFISEEERTIATVLTPDDFEVERFLIEEKDQGQDSEDQSGLDEHLLVIQELKVCLNELQSGNLRVVPNHQKNDLLDDKRCQARRSLAVLHSKMRLAKSLRTKERPKRRHQPATAFGNDITPKSIEELRWRKQSLLKALIRAFDSVVMGTLVVEPLFRSPVDPQNQPRF